jgi:glycosyltransferase involved in cell wall biosynthesis
MTAPLSILHLHGSFELGGKEARALRLMRHFGARARHSILVAAQDRLQARAAIDPSLDVDFAPGAPPLGGRPGWSRLKALARFMAPYDLVLSYNWGAMDGVMAHRLHARSMQLPPLVHHEDGFNADEAEGLMTRRNLYRRSALRHAKAVAVPSRQLEHIAIRAWHVPAEKVYHIPNGIDVAAFERAPQPGAIPGLIPDGRLVIGTLAGLRPVKNLPLLVRAVAPVRDKARLVIVGEGSERDAILAEAERLGVDVVMPGYLPDPARYVGAFDIFALSSDSEQFPIALVEAMAAGRPVVATDVGDIAGMVSSCNRPLIAPPGDEAGLAQRLARLVEDGETRLRLGQTNRQRARECFDEARMIEHYARLYGTAVGEPERLL